MMDDVEKKYILWLLSREMLGAFSPLYSVVVVKSVRVESMFACVVSDN